LLKPEQPLLNLGWKLGNVCAHLILLKPFSEFFSLNNLAYIKRFH
jgi:hypothetical protein